jgi:hypothetical protein
MKQFIYKTLVAIIAIVLIYEFTLGKLINEYTNKINSVSTKEGRKELVISVREELEKAVKKDRYLSKEDAKLINQFLKKIQKELGETEN